MSSLREAERELEAAHATAATARKAAEKGEAEGVGLFDRAELQMEVTEAEVEVANTEDAARGARRDVQRARQRIVILDEREASARRHAKEKETEVQNFQEIAQRNEACSNQLEAVKSAESPTGQNARIQIRTGGNHSSAFVAGARRVAEQTIQRLRTEDELNHPEIEAEAKVGLAALAESDPENALADLMVGDPGASALAGAAWAALADDRDRLEATMAAAVPAATLRNLVIAVSAATIDPVEADPTRSPEEMRLATDLLIGEVGRKLQQAGNSAYVGTAIRQVEDEPAAGELFAALLDTWPQDVFAAMAVEVVMRDPVTPGDLARTVVRLTPGNPWGAHSTTQRSGLAAIAREIRSEPIAEQTALSAFVVLVNRWGFATSSERVIMTTSLESETDDAALQILRELAVPLLEKSLRAVLD